MEINFPNLINTALPDRGDNIRGRNAIILSNNAGPNHNEQGFLSASFPRSTRKLFITAEGDEFDEGTLRAWRDEGFEVRYFGLDERADEEAYRTTLAGLRNVADLGPCETFGIIAFGQAAGICLEYFHHMANNPEFKLACLVAYYPSRIPDPRAEFPGGLRVLVHLTGDEVGVVSHSQIVGIQGKRKVVRRSVERGGGVGGGNVVVGGVGKSAYPCYWYQAPPGFAEGDLDEFEKVAAEVAWSRSLHTVHTAFRMDVELEGIVERNLEGKFFTRNLGQTMSTYTTRKSPHATYFPTLSGGIGTQELRQFYADYFIATNPESTKLTLLSRTVGADRVVDELHVAFKHTQEMPWILPGIPPTNKRVEVAVVSIVTLRGGKLYHEHVYWDQASVLVQVGLLDPKIVPDKAKEKGVRRLPVVGREAARRLVRGFEDDDVGDGEADNEMLPGWYDDEDEGGGGGAVGNRLEEGKEVGKQNGKESHEFQEGNRQAGGNPQKKQENEIQSSPQAVSANGDGKDTENNKPSGTDEVATEETS
ncbi:hypothetical protein E0Z10_g5498 [Xylaria hypoxylon]|uniref:Dienelactone hydrolase n=1 Tax=Xylaria hypoxylon TaxID=37992 RepID=A0A4Z0YIJ3_9PEZI|nr:hypothetical protein E0Z10_g5498 [Xylaria hypoxylon]